MAHGVHVLIHVLGAFEWFHCNVSSHTGALAVTLPSEMELYSPCATFHHSFYLYINVKVLLVLVYHVGQMQQS